MTWILLFIASFFLLFWSGSRVVKSLMKISKYLGWREFVVAFFVMAFAGSLPNLSVGINSALQGIPELAFGEIVGGNVVDLTLAIGLALILSGKSFPVKSKMVQTSALFTAVIALLPPMLILDGDLSRGDGVVLLMAFVLYALWLFSKEERFRKVYKAGSGDENGVPSFWKFLVEKKESKSIKHFKDFFKNLGRTLFYSMLLVLSSWGVVQSVQVFSEKISVGLPMLGILVVGLGNALPETYFAIVSARKGKTWLILGNLMGSIIVCATLVLGIVVLIHPIIDIDFSPFVIARIFLVISAVFFLVVIRTDQRITRKEALILILIYLSFVATEILLH